MVEVWVVSACMTFLYLKFYSTFNKSNENKQNDPFCINIKVVYIFRCTVKGNTNSIIFSMYYYAQNLKFPK